MKKAIRNIFIFLTLIIVVLVGLLIKYNAPNQKKMMSLENLYGSGNHNRFPGFFVL